MARSSKAGDKAAESSKSREGAKVLKSLPEIKAEPKKDTTPGYPSSWGQGAPDYIRSAVSRAEAKAK